MKKLIPLLLSAVVSTAVHADINIGLVLSTTGPGASLGIPEQNTVALLPQEIAGQRINYTVLDDATDSTAATRAARKLVSENKVDLLIGSSTVPTSAAVAQVARETNTPQIALAPFAPSGEAKQWIFTVAQTNLLMAEALVKHMQENGVKTVGYIGYNDVWGEDWHKALEELLPKAGIKLVRNERFNRTDSSVSGQALKINATRPDAVLIGATGTPAALPHTELRRLGYKGPIYHTHGAANSAFLRIGGKDLEGSILAVGPVVVWDQLPDSHPSKAPGKHYAEAYEAKYGAGSLSPFGAYLYDAMQLVEAAIPAALQGSEAGTAEFRQKLRDALEQSRDVAGSHGVYSLSADDHFGHDQRARALITIKDGKWQLLEAPQ
ncbi:ABC transporter substrate-binding protein [Pseudomonas chengduensis]|jgi:branched-chain amino acid transport system substrate-binding protein|uniref:ABC transporter substrate-binding protein n=1 Tax=Ectopseudomonas toyotomiensis TaxID=554344 RepID=A0AA42IPL1_9GAMM|nr:MULTISPECIES: ABC transporter substrate-binding protein [Pseudomonas]MBG0842344.1 ABC transporter substrate-binding protein [Pseudomonas toyotomiensis]MDH0703556.1 ABC transporter substrate-binding protein [Pseudomonas toyotomiensis]MDH1681840.1 ABC transporter substrate-binding protein [Pseudomonas chengduensis]MDN5514225.1 ABC transporter substrate-binding protein [Pseudomonas sp.]